MGRPRRDRSMPPLTCCECGTPDPTMRVDHRPRCKICQAEYRRARRLANLEVVRERERSRYGRKKVTKREAKYGLTEAAFDALLAGQDSRCAICSGVLDDSVEAHRTSHGLHVDHNHETGVVRGLLCGSCNRALGWFKDDADLLMNAWCYLLVHATNPNPVGVG